MNNDEPRDFDEFVGWATRRLHDELLTGGSRAMRSELYVILPYYLKWHREQTKAQS